MLKEDRLADRAKHFIEYARHSREDELDKVRKVFVNLLREQRIKVLQEILQLLNRKDIDEAIFEKRQGQKTSELSEGKAI